MKRILSIVLTLALLLTALPLALSVSAAETVWTLVTDVNELNAGDKVVIVAKDFNYALSTTQNSNNRAQAAVTKSGEVVTFGSDVQICTLEAGKANDSFAFNTGAGYLYAASGSKNHLKTETTLSDNSSWSISIAADGVATIKAQGSNTRNWMRYNSANNPPLFSCYEKGQADICLYVETEDTSSGDTDEPVCEHAQTKYEIVDETTHKIVCTAADCGETVKSESHDFSNGDCICGQKAPVAGESVYDLTKTYYLMATKDNATYYFSGLVNEGSTSSAGAFSTTVADAIEFKIEFDGFDYFIKDVATNLYFKSGTSTKSYGFVETPCAFAYSESLKTLYEKSGERAPAVYVNDNGNGVPTDVRAYDVGTSSNFTKNYLMLFTVVPETAECTHENTTEVVTVKGGYFTEGSKNIVCTNEECKEVVDTVVIPVSENALIKDECKEEFANGKLTITLTYSEALLEDIDKGAKLYFNYSIAGYTKNDLEIPQGTAAVITLEGFNVDRLNAPLEYYLTAKYDGVATDKIVDATKDTLTVAAKADSKTNDLITALNAANANTVVSTDIGATESGNFDKNTITADLKEGTMLLNFVASDDLITQLSENSGLKRTNKITVIIDGVENKFEFTLDVMRKSTKINISGMSFEQLNGKVTINVEFIYEADTTKNISDTIVFEGSAAVEATKSDVATAFKNYIAK